MTKKTGLCKLEHIIEERRLRWLGQVVRMEDSRIPRRAIQWELRGYKRKPGWPRKDWMDIVRQDLKDVDTRWDEADRTGDKQSRMASTCGPIPSGCGMN